MANLMMNMAQSVMDSSFDGRGYDGDFVDVGAAPSGFGSMYDQLFSNNPYRNLTYKKSWFQDLLSSMGFRTKYDDFVEQARINAQEYDADIFSLMQQNEFNDPVAMASRERSAGINPDLLGIGDVAESAKPNEDVNGMNVSQGDDFQVVRDFGMTIASCFTGAMAMAKEGINLFGAMSVIEGTRINNALSMDDLVMDQIRRNIPTQGFKNDADYLEWLESLESGVDSGLKWPQSLAYSLGLSRRSRRSFETSYRDAIRNMPATLEAFNQENQLVDSQKSLAVKKTSRYYHPSFEVMKELRQPLTDLDDDLTRISKENAVANANVQGQEIDNAAVAAGIQGQYLDTLLVNDAGASRALNEIEGLNLESMQQKIDKAVKKAHQSVLNTLSRLADNGNEFAAFMYHNMMLNDFLKFDFKAKVEAGFNRNASPWTSWLPSFGIDAEIGAHY